MYKYMRYILAVLVGVCIGAGLYAISIAKAWPMNQDSSGQTVTHKSPPEVVSCAKNIKILKRTINDVGTPQASVTVEVENTSDLEIIAVSLESKKGKDTFTVLASTFEADEPMPLIKPHETFILTMGLSNVSPNVALQIGSVMYLDGTEEGCESSLKTMRISKTHHEGIKAERKRSQLRRIPEVMVLALKQPTAC